MHKKCVFIHFDELQFLNNVMCFGYMGNILFFNSFRIEEDSPLSVHKYLNNKLNAAITSYVNKDFLLVFLAHLSRRRAYSIPMLRRPSVVHNFKHEYLCNQWADHNNILSEASLG